MAQAAMGGSGNLTPADLRSSPGKRRKERLITLAFKATAWVSILVTLLIVFSLIREATIFLVKVGDLSSLLEIGWFPRRGLYDLRTLIVGTVLVTAIAMAVAVPLGLGAAVYLSEYARPRVRRTVKPALEILAGVPSVVLGYFALSFITPELLVRMNPSTQYFNLAAAGIAVGILTLPLVASVAEDALRAVPSALREAAYGLGGRKIHVVRKVVFPAAISGVVAAFVIGISRAFGETMVVAIASGATGGSLLSFDVFGPGQTMTAAMAALGAGTDQVKGDQAAFQSLYFVGLLLFGITLGLNLFGDRFVRRIRERY
ncbi:MAG: phosphate ABC transporter permease subunit PstC [Egibacteraceae bacterium]